MGSSRINRIESGNTEFSEEFVTLTCSRNLFSWIYTCFETEKGSIASNLYFFVYFYVTVCVSKLMIAGSARFLISLKLIFCASYALSSWLSFSVNNLLVYEISIVIQCFSSESILKAIINPFCSFGPRVLIYVLIKFKPSS